MYTCILYNTVLQGCIIDAPSRPANETSSSHDHIIMYSLLQHDTEHIAHNINVVGLLRSTTRRENYIPLRGTRHF